jgi:hypothetical protein
MSANWNRAHLKNISSEELAMKPISDLSNSTIIASMSEERM